MMRCGPFWEGPGGGNLQNAVTNLGGWIKVGSWGNWTSQEGISGDACEPMDSFED